jgi:hypothetical protein
VRPKRDSAGDCQRKNNDNDKKFFKQSHARRKDEVPIRTFFYDVTIIES